MIIIKQQIKIGYNFFYHFKNGNWIYPHFYSKNENSKNKLLLQFKQVEKLTPIFKILFTLFSTSYFPHFTMSLTNHILYKILNLGK